MKELFQVNKTKEFTDGLALFPELGGGAGFSLAADESPKENSKDSVFIFHCIYLLVVVIVDFYVF